MASRNPDSFAPTEASYGGSESGYSASQPASQPPSQPALASSSDTGKTPSTPRRRAEPYPGLGGSAAAAATSSSGSGSGGQVQSSSQLTPGQGVKRTFWTRRRRIVCFVCAGIVFIIAAVMIPVVIWVILPRVVQLAINNSSFGVNSVQLSAPTTSSFTIALDSQFSGFASFTQWLRFTSDIDVTYNGTKVFTINNPGNIGINSDGTATFSSSFPATYASGTALGDFAKDLFIRDRLDLALNSAVEVKVFGGIFVSGTISNKGFGFNGINQFAGSGVVAWDLLDNATDPFTGIKANLTVLINNPSPFTLDLGDCRFNLSLPANGLVNVTDSATNSSLTTVGGAIVHSWSLKTGANPFPFIGAIDPIDKNGGNTKELITSLFNTFLGSKNYSLALTGLVQTDFGSKIPTIDWINEALQSFNLTLPFIPTDSANSFVQSLELARPSLDFTTATDNLPLLGFDNATTNFGFKFNFPFDVVSVTSGLNLTYKDNVGQRVGAEANSTGSWPPPAGSNRSSIISSLAPKQLVVNDSYTAYQNWVVDIINSNSTVNLGVDGLSNYTLSTKIGQIALLKIPLPTANRTTQYGVEPLKGFKTGSAIPLFQVTGGNPTTLFVTSSLTLTNPSTTLLTMGAVNLNVNYPLSAGTTVGNLSITALTLPRSTATTFNSTIAISNPTAASQTAVSDLLSRFLTSQTVPLTLAGYSGSAGTNRALNAALSNVSIDSLQIPVNTDTVVKQARLDVSLNSFFNATGRTTMTLFNPFDTTLSLTSLTNGTVTWVDPVTTVSTDIGLIEVSTTPSGTAAAYEGLSVPAKSNATTTVTTNLNLIGQNGLNTNRALLQSFAAGSLIVSVRVTLGGVLGGAAGAGFAVPLNYNQTTAGLTINA
ncbi:hypothetical protein DFJ73DRAFT_231748 [Zopfochytrium polystomum]|nr:hypothetical protein DFJ73DRAFT_231748 [Zopfochytrium polystomum]